MAGKRAKDDPKNIEGTGFHYGDPVTVEHKGNPKTKGVVEGIQKNKEVTTPKIDVRIAHPGHKEHGRVVTFDIDDVTALPINDKGDPKEMAETA